MINEVKDKHCETEKLMKKCGERFTERLNTKNSWWIGKKQKWPKRKTPRKEK